MNVLSEIGQGTVAEILVKLPSPPGYNSVRKLLWILEDEGHVLHAQVGRQYVYRPAKAPSIEGQAAFKNLLKQYFGGSIERAIVRYFDDLDNKPTVDQLDSLQNVPSHIEGSPALLVGVRWSMVCSGEVCARCRIGDLHPPLAG